MRKILAGLAVLLIAGCADIEDDSFGETSQAATAPSLSAKYPGYNPYDYPIGSPCPTSTCGSSTSSPAYWQRKIVTLGDSFASGTGIHYSCSSYDDCAQKSNGASTFGIKLGAYSAYRDYSGIPGAKRAGLQNAYSINMAVRGAEIPDVYRQFDVLLNQWPSDTAKGWAGAEFLISIGGNDLRAADGEGWPNILKDLIVGTNAHQWGSNQIVNLSTVKSNLKNLLLYIHGYAPSATIVLMYYPKLYTPGSFLGIPTCGSTIGVNGHEALWADDQVYRLNGEVLHAAAIAASGSTTGWVRVAPWLVERGACKGSDSFLRDWTTHESGFISLHPRQSGYDQYYNNILAVLPNNWYPESCGNGYCQLSERNNNSCPADCPPPSNYTPQSHELGRFSTWCGKVNTHSSSGSAWAKDNDCSSGCDKNTLAYCKKYWPAADTILQVPVTGKTGNIWATAGCASYYPSNGQNEYACLQMCKPVTCTDLRAINPSVCGIQSNGCGGTINCGGTPLTCASYGLVNATTDDTVNQQLSDGCGSSLYCTEGGSSSSCYGNCGGSADGCYCDSVCSSYGDCCADYDQYCY